MNPRDSILVLIHGWGLDRRFWQPMIAALGEEGLGRVRTWDIGFFADPLIEDPGSPAVLVGHSLGWSWGLAHPPQRGWNRIIAINALARFCRADDWPQGVEPRLLRRMRRRFDAEPAATVRAFLQRCGVEAAERDTDDLVLRAEHRRRLRQGLAWLEDWDGRDRLARTAIPRLFLTGGADPILGDVRAPEGAGGGPGRGSTHHRHDRGGHMLPRTHPRWCARRIRAFLEAQS